MPTTTLWRLLLALALLCTPLFSVYAQEPAPGAAKDLEDCIQYAWDHALPLENARLDQQEAEVALESSRADQLPSLNANASHGYNFGRTIDPFSNEFTNTQIRTNNFSLSSNWTLFSGLSVRKQIEQNALQSRAAAKNVEAARNDVALQVAAAYLDVIRFREQLKRFEQQLETTQERRRQVDLFVDEGVRNRSELLEIDAQAAQEALQVTNARNQLDLARLQLRQSMNYPGADPLQLAPIQDTNVVYEEVNDLEGVVQANQDRLPQMQAARLQEEAARKRLEAARGQRYPSLALSSSVTTGYSTQRLTQVGSQTVENTDTVNFNGQQVPLTFTNERPVFETPGFGQQLENNLGQNVRLGLSIPIFNNYRTRSNVRRAMVQQDRAALNRAQSAQQVRNDIYNAYYQRRAAYRQYTSAQKSLEAQKLLLDQVQLRREEQLASYYDLVQVRNNYNQALTQLLEAKYNFLFRDKVFEFYQGKPLIGANR